MKFEFPAVNKISFEAKESIAAELADENAELGTDIKLSGGSATTF